MADGEVDGGEGGGGWRWTSLAAVSSHAARAEGSIGHADGGRSFGGVWTLLEEVFPMAMGWRQLHIE